MTYYSRPGISIAPILEIEVSRKFGISEHDYRSSAKHTAVLSRQVTWYVKKKYFKESSKVISVQYNTTCRNVRHGIKHVQDLLETDPIFANRLHSILSLLS